MNKVASIMKFSLLFLSVLSGVSVFGQDRDGFIVEEYMRYSREKKFNSWSVDVGYGSLIMYTDITDYTIFPGGEWDFGPTIKVVKYLNPAFAFDAQFLVGDMNGSNVGYYFNGDLIDFSISHVGIVNQMLNTPGPRGDKWNFYYKIGFGFTAFRSKLYHSNSGKVVMVQDFNGDATDLRYVVHGYDIYDPDKKIERKRTLLMPIGVGVMYRINRSFDIGIESTMRFSLIDKFDNILVGATNDSYWYTNINLSYKIGKKNRRHKRWTYRGYDFNVFGIKKKYPLNDEIDELENDINNYAANRPVKTDSVFIVHNLKKVYSTSEFQSVFFGSGGTTVDKEDIVILAEMAIQLMKNREWSVDVIGHSDETGDAGNNMVISRKRCETVRDILVYDLGIAKERVTIFSKGETEPLSPTDRLSPRGIHMVNRRVDVVIRK